MIKNSGISASLEDYLEAIFQILKSNSVVHAKNIAEYLKVKKPSVTGALQVLAKKKLINYTPYGVITLTKTGEAIAKDVIKRHTGIANFLITVLGIEKEEAELSACKLEHAMSPNILERFLKFIKLVKKGEKPKLKD